MEQHNSTFFRRHIPHIFTECEKSGKPVMITTNRHDNNQQQMVIISKAQYDIMQAKIKGEL